MFAGALLFFFEQDAASRMMSAIEGSAIFFMRKGTVGKGGCGFEIGKSVYGIGKRRKNLDAHAHIGEIGAEAGFFVGADGGVVCGIDVESQFGEVAGAGPVFQGADDELIYAFAAPGGFDVHKAAIRVVGVF